MEPAKIIVYRMRIL